MSLVDLIKKKKITLLDVQPCLMEVVNIAEECVESNFWLTSTQEMEVDSASEVESSLKVDPTFSSTVGKFVQIKGHHVTTRSVNFFTSIQVT